MALPPPSRADRLALGVQRGVGALLAPLWLTAVWAAIRVARFRFDGLRESRRRYARLRAEPGPLLVCANHLTLVDSFLIGFVLGHPLRFLRHYAWLPWNLPEATIFQRTPALRAGTWLMKCLPIRRGGAREAVAATLSRAAWLLRRGEVVLVFPEGQRSRVGGVDVAARTWAVGRLLHAVPGCRVLCVHLRGVGQAAYGDLPRRGERFRVALSSPEPKSERPGLRGSVELSEQVLRELARLEGENGFA